MLALRIKKTYSGPERKEKNLGLKIGTILPFSGLDENVDLYSVQNKFLALSGKISDLF